MEVLASEAREEMEANLPMTESSDEVEERQGLPIKEMQVRVRVSLSLFRSFSLLCLFVDFLLFSPNACVVSASVGR